MKKWSFFNIPHTPSHPRLHPTHLCPNIPFFPPLLSGKGSSEILPWAKRSSGSYFSVKRMRKILFSHLPSEAPSCWTKMGDHQMELCFLQLIFFFLASFEQNSPFQGEVSSTNTAQPSMYAPINALSNTARIKTIPAGTFTPNPDEKQHGKWLHTFLPKLQLINIQLSSMTNVLQPPVGVHGIKGAAFLPAQAQADPSPACWRRQWDGCARCSSKKPFYSQRTGNKGR